MIGRSMVLGTLLLLMGTPVRAQDAAPGSEEEVMSVVNGLFDAMRAADSAAVKAAFHPELERMASSGRQRDGSAVVMFGELSGFAEAVGGASPGDLNEQIGEAEIRIDDNLATVITPYAFYFKGQLSHCGVNVFLIARTGVGWKIVGLADTRRMQGCEEWLQ